MSVYKAALRPLLFRFDPERVHNWTLRLLPLFPVAHRFYSRVLATRVAGIKFPSPIGLAAGFDKDAQCFRKMYQFGFGFVEVGTLTPQSQAGNARPRIQRLEADSAIINRMGFPNCGLRKAIGRIAKFTTLPGPLGVNIGANADSTDKILDYVRGYCTAAPYADYVAVNVSSPNTPGLRSLESGSGLSELLKALNSEVRKCQKQLFIKVSPDLSAKQIDETCEALLSSQVAGVIVGNTSVARPESLKTSRFDGSGGLSGQPLAKLSELALERFYSKLGARLPIISVGGISSAEDAYRRIRKGASLVQLYTAFIYEGPLSIKRMNAELEQLLIADGYRSVSSAVGADAPQLQATKMVKRQKIRVREAVSSAAA